MTILGCATPAPAQRTRGMMRGGMGMVGGQVISESDINGHVLSSMIQQVVAPETWIATGGPGTLSIYRGILIVRQDETVHEEIGKLLDQLRDKLQQSPSATFGSTAPPKSWLQLPPGMDMEGGMPRMGARRRTGGGMPGMGGGMLGGEMPGMGMIPGGGMSSGMRGGMTPTMRAPAKPKKSK